MISAVDLTLRFPRAPVPALSRVTAELSGGITALLGANGAGKTTLLRTLSGALRPTSGGVKIDGLDPYARSDRRAALASLALMPQASSAPRNLTALEFVTYLTWMRGHKRTDANQRASQALESVGLGGRSGDTLGSLSGGMVRRVWLAQALAVRADVLLLDEPSTGLDPRQRATMVELLRERATGTVLLSSHLLEDVISLASAVIVLRKGEVVHHGPMTPDLDEGWLLELIGDYES